MRATTDRSWAKEVTPRCEDCFFGRRGLCALDLGEPCASFRADGPNGLAPARQPMLLFGEASARPVPQVDIPDSSGLPADDGLLVGLA